MYNKKNEIIMNATISDNCDCGENTLEMLLPPFIASVCLLLIEQALAASNCKANSTLQLITGAVKHIATSKKADDRTADV